MTLKNQNFLFKSVMTEVYIQKYNFASCFTRDVKLETWSVTLRENIGQECSTLWR
jgi:hypothetical protein